MGSDWVFGWWASQVVHELVHGWVHGWWWCGWCVGFFNKFLINGHHFLLVLSINLKLFWTKSTCLWTINLTKIEFKSRIWFFFNVGPPKEDIFLGHLLCPIFQSTLHITIASLCLGVDTVTGVGVSWNKCWGFVTWT